jgi:hypothetical protein
MAGAMVGAELSRRAAENNRGTSLGEFLGELHREIVEDRQTLQRVMTALGVERSALKPAGAWVLEKAGRLKLNGQIRGYSPLSQLVELEGSRPVSRASAPSGKLSPPHPRGPAIGAVQSGRPGRSRGGTARGHRRAAARRRPGRAYRASGNRLQMIYVPDLPNPESTGAGRPRSAFALTAGD